MKSTIFIPKKIKVGFNPRTDTYTGKLGYVIYHDGKKWRKEESWNSWRYHYVDGPGYEAKKKTSYDRAVKQYRDNYKYVLKQLQDPNVQHYYKQFEGMTEDQYINTVVQPYDKYIPHDLGRILADKSIDAVEYDNTPIEGFVLNKKAGGYKSGWDFRQTYCRVYDPRGFEFEITIPNLLYVLDNSTSIKGKGLEGKFIYGWDGKDLVLIPEEAPEFKEMVAYTELQEGKIKKKDLKIGGVYLTASNERVTYLGEYKHYSYDGVTDGEKKSWFYQDKRTPKPLSISTLKRYVEDDPDIAMLLDKLEKEPTFKPKKTLVIEYELWNQKHLATYLEKNRYYSYNHDVYIPAKTKGKYIQIRVSHDTQYNYEKKRNNNDFYLQKGRKGAAISEKFESLEKLIEKHPLYKQTRKNEEKDK